uniref:LysM domain containing 3 n=1 Tax=Eptatretus burgeri TaxID=7764 RepID=A0A8C4RF57_EPTBU
VLSPRTPDNMVYLDTAVQDGDTLVSFALHYGCTVAEIKRANNLISEQDFYALRTLKIPVPRYGVMTELLEDAGHREPCYKPGAFLVEVDRNLEAIVRSADSLSPKEEPRLTASERGAGFQRHRRQMDPCDGADCGLRWWNAVAAMLLVGIATPLLYLLYHQLQIPFHVSMTTPEKDMFQKLHG